MPVEFVADLASCADLSDTLLFIRDDAAKAQALSSADAAPRNVRLVRERDLAAKFGLWRATASAAAVPAAAPGHGRKMSSSTGRRSGLNASSPWPARTPCSRPACRG